MKRKYNAGFSLVEVLAAIAVLAILFVPTCTSLMMSMKINNGTQTMMRAEHAVSSAVEKLMAEGIEEAIDEDDAVFSDVTVVASKTNETDLYYNVTVTSKEDASVSVTTRIRSVISTPQGGGSQ